MPIYKNKIFISLLIIAILVVCYFLFGKNLINPPRASQSLTLYNIDSRGGDGPNLTVMPTRTVRWETLPVAIYDKVGIKNIQNIIDDWNRAMGQEVFKIGGPDSPIVINGDPKVSPAGTFTYSFRKFLLNNFQITVNPLWINSSMSTDMVMVKNPDNILKNLLGRALGFFGHTTDDSDSVMNLDWPLKEKTIISPFVVSVLKELYGLPAGARSITTIDSQLRWSVKKYNIDSRPIDYKWDTLYNWGTLQAVTGYKTSGGQPNAEMPILTLRWRSLPVAVYDRDKIVPKLNEVIDNWNQSMGKKVFIIGGPDSPIVIEADPNQGPYELVKYTPQNNGILDKIQIINNPNWTTSDKIRHQLGHALGFFGHTTDDPDGVMDADYDKQKTISPLVVSVLNELYKLPPGVKIVDQFGRPEKEVLALRQAVKQYNNDSRGDEELAIRIIRWRSLPVSIYNQANVSGLEKVLNDWNQAMGQEVFKVGGSDSPIVIKNASSSTNLYPGFNAEIGNYLLTSFNIEVNSQNTNLHYLEQQLGHVLGFFGYTADDDPNGIMNKDYSRNDTVISPFVVSVIKELYNLSPGALISY